MSTPRPLEEHAAELDELPLADRRARRPAVEVDVEADAARGSARLAAAIARGRRRARSASAGGRGRGWRGPSAPGRGSAPGRRCRCRRWRGGRARRSGPPRRRADLAGVRVGRAPARIFIRVDLPAPFSPTTAWTCRARRRGPCRRGPEIAAVGLAQVGDRDRRRRRRGRTPCCDGRRLAAAGGAWLTWTRRRWARRRCAQFAIWPSTSGLVVGPRPRPAIGGQRLEVGEGQRRQAERLLSTLSAVTISRARIEEAALDRSTVVLPRIASTSIFDRQIALHERRLAEADVGVAVLDRGEVLGGQVVAAGDERCRALAALSLPRLAMSGAHRPTRAFASGLAASSAPTRRSSRRPRP